MRKLFLKQPYVSSFKNQNKFFIYPTSVAMATCRRTIDRAHFALLGQFLTISEHISLFLGAGPNDKQNDTLHAIALDEIPHDYFIIRNCLSCGPVVENDDKW